LALRLAILFAPLREIFFGSTYVSRKGAKQNRKAQRKTN
jgi:hypothetical protein